MTARIFVAIDARNSKWPGPELRTIHRDAWSYAIEHRGRNSDIGNVHDPAMQSSRQQHMSRLAPEKGDGLRRHYSGSHHSTTRTIDAARQIGCNDRNSARIH